MWRRKLSDFGITEIGEDLKKDKQLLISTYPNLRGNEVFINSNYPIKVNVFNLMGEQILSTDNTKTNPVTLNQKGVYIFELSTGKERVYRKVVIAVE